VEVLTAPEKSVFAGLINQAKSAVSRVVLQYAARACVAVPFVIALGFALAAVAVMLVERFGHIAGYWMMAGGLAAIGVIGWIVVSVKEHEEDLASCSLLAVGVLLFISHIHFLL
jgi:hypothetical protein